MRRCRESGTTVAVRVQQAPLGLARPGCVSIDKGRHLWHPNQQLQRASYDLRTVMTLSEWVLTWAAQAVRALDSPRVVTHRLACEGGALPVSVSITGPREPRDYRACNPMRLSRSTRLFLVFSAQRDPRRASLLRCRV